MAKKNNIVGEYKIVEIEKVFPNSWNPKDSIEENNENKIQYEFLGKSVERKGFVHPILVRQIDKGWEILDGYHRWRVQKDRGENYIAVVDLGVIKDEAEAMSYTIDSEIIKIPVNEIKLAELTDTIFKSLDKSVEETHKLLPMSKESISEMVNLSNFDWSDYKVTFEQDNERNQVLKKESAGSKVIHFKLTEDLYLILEQLFEKDASDLLNKVINCIRGLVSEPEKEGE